MCGSDLEIAIKRTSLEWPRRSGTQPQVELLGDLAREHERIVAIFAQPFKKVKFAIRRKRIGPA
jgi:hypothetical protein